MDETIGSGLVPADPGRPGFDVLGARLTTRTHYINCSLAAAGRPLTPTAIGDRAREIALRCGYPVRSTTFAGTSTRAHLVALRAAAGGALAEPLGDGRWRLTPAARRRIAAASATATDHAPRTGAESGPPSSPGNPADRRGRSADVVDPAGPEGIRGVVRPLSVLVVEDYPDGAESLAALLGAVGHSVATARDGPAALAAVGVSRPDAVLIDVGLPGEDGFAVARRVCAALPDRPLLVAMTGFQGLEARSKAEGFDLHFLKPADPAALLSALAAHAAKPAGSGR